MILAISPESPALIRDGAALILVLHIGGGLVGVTSGAAALILRKGGFWHRAAGDVFVVAMLIMAVIGAAVSPFLPQPQLANDLMAVFCLYLVLTGWATVQRGSAPWLRLSGPFLAVVSVAGEVAFALAAISKPHGVLGGLPFAAPLVFAAVTTLALAGDVRAELRGGLTGGQRLARHLWRMCVALLIATLSAMTQPRIIDLLPDFARRSGLPLALPLIAILAAMLFWLVRVKRMGAGRPANGRREPPPQLRLQTVRSSREEAG